ncbi:GSCOCG00000578001-RA-CDS [Cotesia congregata]|nr:GSCOCG00000578001-RA-CDS [Cotesia congregata]
MTMTSGTNKWASRAVVILQLAAWSAVGIVLLQKGVSSLQKGSEIRNITQTMPNTAGSNNPIEKDISVISIVEDSKPRESEELPISRSGNSRIWDAKSMVHKLEKLHEKKANELNSPDEFDEKIDGPRVLESLDSSKEEKLSEDKKDIFISKKSGKTKLADLDELKPLTDIKDVSMKLILPGTNSSLQRQSGMLESERAYEDTYQRPLNFSSLPEDTEKNNKTRLAPVQTSTTKPSIWETRRRLRLSHLSGGGAAAAVAMVAVGAVMLVLGPAVIVLRALDERRQERRFLKLSARDDLPPTYEQATLMDEAPRYSSLSLNTILGPPPPPSPTPARVQLV